MINPQQGALKPVLIHLHIYWPQFRHELYSSVENIKSVLEARLYVTISQSLGQDPSPEITLKSISEEIKRLDAQAVIKICPNLGYDLAPFISVLNEIKLQDFSYVIKLHTKRDMPDPYILLDHDVSGPKWRELLLYPFSDATRFKAAIDALQNQSKLGAVAHFKLIARKKYPDKFANPKALAFLVERMNFDAAHLPKLQFIMGTMFIMRAQLLLPLQRIKLGNKDFSEGKYAISSTCTLAHILERLLGWLAVAQGYQIKDIYHSVSEQREFKQKICRFIFRSYLNRNGYYKYKILGITMPWSKPYRLKAGSDTKPKG